MKICQPQTMFHFQETSALHFLEALINVSAGRSRLLCLLLNVNQSDFIKNLRQEGEWKSIWLCACLWQRSQVEIHSEMTWEFHNLWNVRNPSGQQILEVQMMGWVGVRLMRIYWQSLLCKMRNKVPSIMSGQVNSASKHSINHSTNS